MKVTVKLKSLIWWNLLISIPWFLIALVLFYAIYRSYLGGEMAMFFFNLVVFSFVLYRAISNFQMIYSSLKIFITIKGGILRIKEIQYPMPKSISNEEINVVFEVKKITTLWIETEKFEYFKLRQFQLLNWIIKLLSPLRKQMLWCHFEGGDYKLMNINSLEFKAIPKKTLNEIMAKIRAENTSISFIKNT